MSYFQFLFKRGGWGWYALYFLAFGIAAWILEAPGGALFIFALFIGIIIGSIIHYKQL